MAEPTKADLKRNLKALKKRLVAKPMDLDARMRMARTHRLLGNKRRSISHYRAVARYISLSGQPMQAIAVLKELLGVDPQHKETLLFLAKLYARTSGDSVSGPGRIARPIARSFTDGPIALPDGMPATESGLWKAIRPQGADVQDVHTPAEHEAPISIAAELRELEETYAVAEDDVVEVHHADAFDSDPLSKVPDVTGDGFEVLGGLTTEDLVLPKVALFSELDALAFIELGHAMVFHRAGAGEVIFDEGDAADSFLVIARGEAVATRRGIELMTLQEGDFAGLFALLARGRRHARLTARSYVEYFEIDRDAVDGLLAKHESARVALDDLSTERTLMHALASLPGLRDADADKRREIANGLQVQSVAPEEIVARSGASTQGLYVVLSGRLAIEIDDETEIPLEPGDCYLHAGPAIARRDVRAVVNSRVAVAGGDFLRPLVGATGELTARGWSIGGDEYCVRDLLV